MLYYGYISNDDKIYLTMFFSTWEMQNHFYSLPKSVCKEKINCIEANSFDEANEIAKELYNG